MLTDIEIAQQAEMEPIKNVAAKLGMSEDDIEMYGKYKAKISDEYMQSVKNNENGKLILVTAINPTPAGEGKTTVTVGLGQAMCKLGKKAVIALREPSLGPCFGIKGGAAGGGYAQVVPMEDLNLHFTGDFHAITSANNLLAAVMDNHMHQGNTLRIDPKRIVFKRCLDMNDRVLRNIIVGMGKKGDGVMRQDGFVITVASEIMAILCLAIDIKDLQERLSRIIVAYNVDNEPVTAGELKCVGAMTALLKDAIKPNLIQTLEHTPALVHGGPFANIAHGCNSVRATQTALKIADYVITEAGFGADLGAEKFFDIKCRMTGLKPDAVVLVATVRALKYNGGVAIALANVWEKGGEGGIELANAVLNTLETKESHFKVLYEDNLSIKEKIETIAKKIYGADGVTYSAEADRAIAKIEEMGFANMPVCMAKNQYSLSDDAKKLGRPTGFTVNIREVYVSAGAGFVVAITGAIMTMPGLPKVPAAERIYVDDEGVTHGLF